MHVAAIKGDHDGVKKLLEQGMGPNIGDFAGKLSPCRIYNASNINKWSSLGWTPLHEACNHGHYNVAMILVRAGANVNAKGLENNTPLHDAAIVGQLKLVKMLLERGADPCFKNSKGKTPCDVAAPAVYNYLIAARGEYMFLLLFQVHMSGNFKRMTGVESSFAPFLSLEVVIKYNLKGDELYRKNCVEVCILWA